MILVLLGTQDKPFTRLLDAIQDCIDKKVIKDRVIVQAGHTKYESDEMEIFDLLPKDIYDETIKKANLIICHGGVSSIFDGLKNNIPVIVAARLQIYKEHTNDHQVQIINKFAQKGYVIPLDDFSKLDEAIEKSKTFKVKKFKSTTDKIIKLIDDYIKSN